MTIPPIEARTDARTSPPEQAIPADMLSALEQAPPSSSVGPLPQEESAAVTEDELRRWTIDIVNGRPPSVSTPEKQRVVARLVSEIAAIQASGGEIELPFDIPDTKASS